MKILIMYKSWAAYLPRFVLAGEKLGAEVELAHFTDLTLETGEVLRLPGSPHLAGRAQDDKAGLKSLPALSSAEGAEMVTVRVNGRDVGEFDAVYVRSVGLYHEEMTVLADYCRMHNRLLLERSLASGNVDQDHKSFEALRLLSAGLNYPPSFFGSGREIMRYLSRRSQWPVVIKDTAGKRGRGVYLISDYSIVEKLFKGRVKRNYVVQDYIENDGEYRVWVIGGKVLAAMHRPVRIGELEMVGITGRSKKVKVESEMEKLAVAAAEAVGVEVAGIDIVVEKSTGKPFVLEVNRAGMFGTFEKVTGVDVVEAIMAWVVGEARRYHKS